MEHVSLLLIMLTFLESLLVALLVYSLLSLEIFDKKYIMLVIVVTGMNLLVRSFPVIPLIIIFFGCLTYIVYIKICYRISALVTTFAVMLSVMVYMLVEGITVPIMVDFFELTYQDIVNNYLIRLSFFSIQIIIMVLIILFIRYYKVNFIDLYNIFNFEDLKVLAEDEIDLSQEKRVVSTIYLVFIFLLLQGLFINTNILGDYLFKYFEIYNFFTFPIFVNSFIILLNLILVYLLRYLVITLRLERNDIVKRIKEKNANRLDWEKRAQMHDSNHHLGMLYILLQVNKIDRAKEYLKGMVGEIQNVDAIVKSGNQSLNALIRSKIALGKKSGVTVSVTVNNRLKRMNIMDWDLNRIIGNLLDNAIEASEKKEGSRKIDLIIDSGNLTNKFEVITHGIVIKEEIREHIFDKGYTSKEEEGHGLGLAICKELVDAYKGDIKIKKDKYKNYTSFQVLMPVS